MSTTELREAAKRHIDNLSDDRLLVATDFLAYLDERESKEATEELLKIPGLLDELKRAEEDAAAGRLTRMEDLKRKS
jgi:hypothetical protein